MFDRILIATDNVDIIDNALIYIDKMFSRSKLHVSSIYDKKQITTQQLNDVFRRLSKEGAEATAELTREKLEELGMKGEVTVVEGNPAEEISNYVKKNDIDLVMAETYDKYGLRTTKLEPLLENLARMIRVPLLVLNKPEHLNKPSRILVVQDEGEKVTAVKRVANYLHSTYGCSFTFLIPRADKSGSKTKLTKPILDMGLSLKTRGARVGALTDLTTLANAAIEHSQTHDLLVFSHHRRKMTDFISNTLKKVLLSSLVPVMVVYPHHRIRV